MIPEYKNELWALPVVVKSLSNLPQNKNHTAEWNLHIDTMWQKQNLYLVLIKIDACSSLCVSLGTLRKQAETEEERKEIRSLQEV